MKYDLIAEAYISILIEGRIDDLKKQNPNLSTEIDSYSSADPTPQKKFVPWLVSQHKKGNVTPDEPNLNQTLSGFETYKSRHGIKDHSSKSYQEIRDAVQPFLGTATTNKDLKKQQVHEGIDQIYSSDDGKIQAFRVKTKEASQHVYGGGKKLGGLHTDWCVAARSENCLFGKYGAMYTVHVKDDPKSPYAIHLSGRRPDRITTRDNAPDEYELNTGLEKMPHLKNAVNAIKDAHKITNPEDDAELLRKLKNKDELDIATLHKAVKHINPEIAHAALQHPNADNMTTFYAAENPNTDVLMSAMQHPKIFDEAIAHIAERSIHNPNTEVITTALRHKKADKWAPFWATQHPNVDVALEALRHKKADADTISAALEHPNTDVVIAALKHPKAAKKRFIQRALEHPDQKVKEFAQKMMEQK